MAELWDLKPSDSFRHIDTSLMVQDLILECEVCGGRGLGLVLVQGLTGLDSKGITR